MNVQREKKKVIASYLLIISLILTMYPCNVIHAEEHYNAVMVNTNLMINDYIGLFVSDSGQFSIGTTEGNPENNRDNNQRLLFGYSGRSTSYTTFCIDGIPYIYAGANVLFNTDLAKHTSEWNKDDVHVVQELSFCKNSATGRQDVVEIKYIVTNDSEDDRMVGCRIMMDTQLGGNDCAPFRVPGYGAVTSETEFEGDNIPQIWQAFDDLSNPGVIAQGRFYKNVSERPDKVQFANWSRLSDTSWDLKINKESGNGDSGVAATWYEEKLKPGETREYKTYYGLSELTQDLTGPLLLSVYSESGLEIVDSDYAPNPFPVNAYIENVGTDTIDGVKAYIELPEGLILADGCSKIIDIGNMERKKLVQANWQVSAKPTSQEQYYKIKIFLEYGNGESKAITRTVHVPALMKKALPKALGYTLFSESSEQNISMYGWQSYITGNVYSGNDYSYQGSILNVTGVVDAVGTVITNGWQLHIDETNEGCEKVDMPDLDSDITKKAGITENYSEGKTFTEDTITLDKSIYSEQDITFSGTVFSGEGYVIANKNITCNINQGNTYNDGKVVMYAKQGNIALNGSEIALDGILYAPNGTVFINANVFRLRGRIIAKQVVMNTSQNYIECDDRDITYIYDGEYEIDTPISKGFYENTFLEEEISQGLNEENIFITVCDAGVENTNWNHIIWNGIRPDDSNIEVTIAVSNDEENYSDAILVRNGETLEDVKGRYARVTATLKPATSSLMPRLVDVTVSTEAADLVINAKPILNLEKTVYETVPNEPVRVVLGSLDDAVGNVSTYTLQLNSNGECQDDMVSVTDISALEKEIVIGEKGIYDFTLIVSDGEYEAEQIISVCVIDMEDSENNGNESNHDEDNPNVENPSYTITSQIQKVEFNEDYSLLQIYGTASALGHLKDYKLSYGYEDGELQIISEGEAEIEEGVLGEIPTENLHSGNYVLVLRVEDNDGNVCEGEAHFELSAGQVIPGEEKEENSNSTEDKEDEKLSEEEILLLQNAKQRAIDWLKAQSDENGSWSKDGLMNTTCDALAVLKSVGETVESPAYNTWVESIADDGNVDEQCHALMANPNVNAKNQLWEQQNEDGGFGLTRNYSSDLYDTLLVVRAEIYMQELGYSSVDSTKLINALLYIATNRNVDGGFGYNDKDGSRVTLTAEYAVILAKCKLSLTDDNSLDTFCSEIYSGDFSEDSFMKQAMLGRVMQQLQNESYTRNNMGSLFALQKEDGSVYENVEDTMIYIVLLDEMIKGGE